VIASPDGDRFVRRVNELIDSLRTAAPRQRCIAQEAPPPRDNKEQNREKQAVEPPVATWSPDSIMPRTQSGALPERREGGHNAMLIVALREKISFHERE
jgi:hypothetical protein